MLYSKARKLSGNLGTWALILSLLSADFMLSLYICNAGGMITAFILIAWLICDEHEYLSGVLLGFAMVKPQVAAIVCLVFLMMRKFKPLIVAAAIDLSAWVAVSVMTHKGMLELLRLFLFSPNRGENSFVIFRGIFTCLFEPMTAIAASMLFGILFVYCLHRFLPDNMPEMFKIYPAFVAITFWCYSTVNDSYVLIVPALVCVYLMLITDKVVWFLSAIYCSYGTIIRSVIKRVMSAERNLQITVYEVGLIILSVIICLELRRIYSEAKS